MNEREFSVLIHETKKIVLSAVAGHLHKQYYHAIDDVVQETYLRAYRHLAKNGFRGESKISSWLFAIARNESLRMNEKLAREEKKFRKCCEREIAAAKTDTRGSAPDPADLAEAISGLPLLYKPVMELVAGGHSIKEIARKLAINEGTVKSRSAKGRELLLEALTGGAQCKTIKN